MSEDKKTFKKIETSSLVDPNKDLSTPEKKSKSGIFINEEIRSKLIDAVKKIAENAREEQVERYKKLFNGEE